MDTRKRGMVEEAFHREGGRDLSDKIACVCERDMICAHLQKGKSVPRMNTRFAARSLNRCALLHELTTWGRVLANRITVTARGRQKKKMELIFD